MGKIIVKVLQDNILQLNDRLNCETCLLDIFLSEEPPLLTKTEIADILSKTTPRKQNDAFEMTLMRKDDRALHVLYEYLKDNGDTELVTALEKSAEKHKYGLC